MSRRSFPRIDPAALRDHADEARVERVWERVERDLTGRPRAVDARARRSSIAYVAIAATLSAFGAGVLVGKAAWSRRAPADTLVVAPVIEKSEVEVLAAGTMSRTIPLPGGGSITLEAGATVEVEKAGAALTLKLLQGNASIDTATHKVLALVAGETQLSAPAGSRFSVNRNADDLDVRVEAGTVSVSSPAGAQQLAKGEQALVPFHTMVAAGPPPSDKARRQILLPHPSPTVAPKGVANMPEWLAKHRANDDATALQLLQKQNVDALIKSSKSSDELNAISEIMRKGNAAMEMRACERLVNEFPRDQWAYVAAARLAQIYEGRGDAGRAKQYRDKQLALAESAKTGSSSLICDMIRHHPDKTKAALMAKEYLDKYPDGDCREAFEQMLAAQPAAPASAADAVDDGSSAPKPPLKPGAAADPAHPEPAKPSGDPPKAQVAAP